MPDVNNGALSFKAVLDNGDLNNTINETVKRIQGLSSQTVATGEQIDKAFEQASDSVRSSQEKMAGATRENLEIQKRVIAQLQAEYDKLRRAIDETPRGKGRVTLIQEAEKIEQAIKEEKQALTLLAGEVQKTEQVHASLRTQIKQVSEEMARLNPHSEKYRKLQQELGRLKDIQGDIMQAAKVFANDEAKFQGVIVGLQGVAGGFSAATGAVSLFADENENLQRVMAKVQSVMSIAIGMQSVAQALNKDSAFRLVTLRGFQEAYNASKAKYIAVATAGVATTHADTIATNVATSAKVRLISTLRALWATMIANPITATIALLGAFVAGVYKMTEAGRKAEKQQKALNEKVIELAGEPVGAFVKLRTAYEALGKDLKGKQKFIDSNTDAFKKLGLSIKDVADAERVLILQSDKFIQAQIAKAKASALLESNEYKETLKKLIDAEQKEKKYAERFQANVDYGKRGGKVDVSHNAVKGNIKHLKEAQAERSQAEAELKRMQELSNKYELEGQRLIDGLNKGASPISGTIEARRVDLQNRIKALEHDYERLKTTDAKGIRENRAQREALQKELDSLDTDTKQKKAKENPQERETSNLLKQAMEDYKRAMEEHKAYLRSKLTATERYLEQDKELREAYDKEQDPTKKQAISLQRDALKQRYDTESIQEGDKKQEERRKLFEKEQKEREKLLEDFKQKYQTTEEQLTEISKHAEEQRKLARELGLEKTALPQIDKEEQEAKAKLAFEELQANPVYEKLFGNIDELATSELEKILESFEGKTAHLGIALKPEDLAVIKEKLQSVKDTVRERNPFKAIVDGVKEYKKASNDAEKKGAVKNIGKSAVEAFGEANKAIGVAQQALSAFGIDANSTLGEALGKAQEIVSGGAQFAKGLATGNPLDMISGGISVVSSVISIFNTRDKDAQKAIKKHQSNLQDLAETYSDLERKINKALGGSAYKHQSAAIDNMKAQQRELDGMIEAERRKKKTDEGKIKEWRARKKELDHKQAEMVDKMHQSLLGGDAKSVANQFGNALIQAFENGKDAAKAWGDTVREIVNGVVKNLLIQKVLQEPLGKIIEKYTSRWVDKNGNFNSFNRVEQDLGSLESELKGLYPRLEGTINALKNRLKLDPNAATDTSLTGAVKGVTEETASIVAGYLNAMRMNQGEANNMLRQQLVSLNAIAHNTSYNRLLVEVVGELKSLRNTGQTAGGDPLRGKGLTGG